MSKIIGALVQDLSMRINEEGGVASERNGFVESSKMVENRCLIEVP